MAFMDVGDMSLIFDMSFMAWLGVWLMPHSIRVGARENAPSICPWQILQARPLNRMKASKSALSRKRGCIKHLPEARAILSHHP